MKKQRGSTIVELLLYMGLLAGLLVVLSDMFISILEVKTDTQKTSSVEQDGRYIVSRLIYDINRASSITTPSAAGGSGATLVLVIGGVSYTYAVSGNYLQLTNNLGTFDLNGDETRILNTSFNRIGNEAKDTITAQFDVVSQDESTTFKTTAGLR